MSSPTYRARAPLRVSFAGGGTDVPPFPAREGGVVLSATINRYAYASLEPHPDPEIVIESADLQIAIRYALDQEAGFDGRLDLAKATIRALGGSDQGFSMFLRTNAPPGSGLGSSSAIVVTMIGVLQEFRRLPLTEYEIAELACRVERHDLGISGGLQDQYAATFGGFNFIEFSDDRVLVNPLRVKAETIHELEHNLLLADTGATRPSDHIIDDQVQRFESGNADALDALRKQKEFAIEMKALLLANRLNEFGRMLGEAWEAKRRMSSRIATPFIDEAYDTAVRAGALGGKVTGAGGGGHMLFYCPRNKHRVMEALTRYGVSVSEFSFDTAGLTTWRSEA